MESDITVGPFTFLHVYRTLVCREGAAATVHLLFLSVKYLRTLQSGTRRSRLQNGATLSRKQQIYQTPSAVKLIYKDFVFLRQFDCVPYLAPPKKDGLKCHKCPYIARQVQKIQKHCKLKHKWENPQGPGRPDTKQKKAMQNELSRKHEVPWREGVHCQRFFPSRCASGWFEVGRKAMRQKKPRFCDTGYESQQTTRQRRHTAATETALQEHLEAALGRHQQHLDAQRRTRVCAKKMGNGSLASYVTMA